MENERSVDRLSRYIITAAVIIVAGLLAWYFRSILIYIIGAFVVSLIGQPLMTLFRKIRIKGKAIPDGILAVLTLVLIILFIGLVITQVFPIISSILSNATVLSKIISDPLDGVNEWLKAHFPGLGDDFDLVALTIEKIRGALDLSRISTTVSGLLGSVASAITKIGIGLFSIIFISFFFIKDDTLFPKIVSACVSDNVEDKVTMTIQEIGNLLSRYFVGLILEMFGVALLDFLGLWLIARFDVGAAMGVAFIAGLLNIIPYVGPFLGNLLGIIIGVLLKLGSGMGLDVSILAFALIIFAIMLFTQMIDNFIYQPLIYSTSIKAHPLEIFIVLLIAGQIGGALGMLASIPAYTVIRVIASRFFYHFKPVRRLIPDREDI